MVSFRQLLQIRDIASTIVLDAQLVKIYRLCRCGCSSPRSPWPSVLSPLGPAPVFSHADSAPQTWLESQKTQHSQKYQTSFQRDDTSPQENYFCKKKNWGHQRKAAYRHWCSCSPVSMIVYFGVLMVEKGDFMVMAPCQAWSNKDIFIVILICCMYSSIQCLVCHLL